MLNPDPHHFADDKLKCMENEPIWTFFKVLCHYLEARIRITSKWNVGSGSASNWQAGSASATSLKIIEYHTAPRKKVAKLLYFNTSQLSIFGIKVRHGFEIYFLEWILYPQIFCLWRPNFVLWVWIRWFSVPDRHHHHGHCCAPLLCIRRLLLSTGCSGGTGYTVYCFISLSFLLVILSIFPLLNPAFTFFILFLYSVPVLCYILWLLTRGACTSLGRTSPFN